MPRASPAFPRPADEINRFGIKNLSPIELTTCAVGRAAACYRPVLAAHHSATNFTESPISDDNQLDAYSIHRMLRESCFVRNSSQTRIVLAASAAATVSAASCQVGSRSCTQTTPQSPPSASCPLPAPARTNPCSNGACACRNPSGPE
jgi:hypothetical protein